MTPAARRRLAAVTALVVAALAIWLWRRDRPAAPAPAPAAPTARARPAIVAPPVVPAIDMAAMTKALTDPALVATYLDQYQQANRYPATTVRLVAGMDDALAPDRLPGTDVAVPGVRNLYTQPSHRLYYRLETDQVRYVAPAAVTLTLTVFRGDVARVPVAIQVAPVEIQRIHPDGQRVGLGTATLAAAGPGTYTLRYAPPRRRGATDDDLLHLIVTWSLADGTGKPVTAHAPILYTAFPAARFTGRVTDRVVDGSLAVEVEVESERAGPARVAAHLFAADGTTPIAGAHTTATLGAGRTWVALSFYGLAIRDSGQPGPYQVRTLRGHFPTTTSSGRGSELAHADRDHTTAAYPLDDFTAAVWDSPEKRAAIAAYQAELARLRTAPAPAQPPSPAPAP